MEQELRLGNVTCPVQHCKVSIIENLNNLRINVFGYEDEEVFPLYISKREDTRVINLLYIIQGDDKHYCLIRNMSRLLGDLTKHDNFEALVEPLQNIPGKTASHIPCGYAYLIIGPNGLQLKPVTVYRESDAVNHFNESIAREKDILAAELRTITPMHMTTSDLEVSKRDTLQLVQKMAKARQSERSRPPIRKI
ncbi:hypothetical protein AVEN_10326-1 [Araneus ventricosus]|uniref:Uncharacterized protein n=1 Tax=Araneus ventricosus TaxID=182803 RepID=A0A4Y2P962_ARAVE|nr:hypothetical protein AVEN_10326-1 [Araneus ventricosus]